MSATGDADGSATPLFGIEMIRRRPGMFVGATDHRALSPMVASLLCPCVDHYRADTTTHVLLRLDADGSITVSDDGYALTPIWDAASNTMSFAGEVLRPYDNWSPTARSAHGVGAFLGWVPLLVIAALSEQFQIETWQDGAHWVQNVVYGVPVGGALRLGPSTSRGMSLTFRPDRAIFDDCRFDAQTLDQLAREMAYLCDGLSVRFVDAQIAPESARMFCFQDGLSTHLINLASDKAVLHAPITKTVSVGATEVSLAFQYVGGTDRCVKCYVNGYQTIDGGTHEKGLYRGLAAALNEFGRRSGLCKDNYFDDKDMRPGLYAVLRAWIDFPHYSGSTRVRLGDPEVFSHVALIVASELTLHQRAHPALWGELVTTLVRARMHRLCRRFLDWPWQLRDRDYYGDEVALRSLREPASLRRLFLEHTELTGEGLACLQHLPDLEELSLWFTGVQDDELVYLRYVPGLRQLSLRSTRVTGSGIAHLGGLTRLQELDLAETAIDDDALALIGRLSALESLDLRETAITDAGLPALYGLARLRTLDLTDTSVNNGAVVALQRALPHCEVTTDIWPEDMSAWLEWIRPRDKASISTLAAPDQPFGMDFSERAWLDADAIDLAGKHIGLRALNLADTRLIQTGGVPIDFPPTLEELDLIGAVIDKQTLDCLRTMSGLRRLLVGNIDTAGRVPTGDTGDIRHITAADLTTLAASLPLEMLCLSYLDLDRDHLAEIGAMPSLRKLSLPGCNLEPGGLASLRSLQALQRLDLSYSTVRGPDLAGLCHCPNLQALWLTDTAIDDTSAYHLERMTGLRVLDVSGTAISNAAALRLQSLSALRYIDFGYTAIDDSAFSQGRWSGDLRYLSLRYTTIGDKGIEAIGRMSGLRHLDLSYTKITDACLVHLAALDCLIWLKLDGTRVTMKGLAHLRDSDRLRHLRLGASGISLDDIAAIQRALPDCAIFAT
jgi:Leucine-rich repeat (LRR) protein